MKSFIKGMDVSSLGELERLGAKYYKDGQEKELLEKWLDVVEYE